jgi:hypothetical protein
MTLILAVNSSSSLLNPERSPLRFEPGIALAVDTRFSFVGSPRVDNRAVKWFELAPYCLAAYCGDVEFAETVFRCTAASCIDNKKLDHPIYIRSALRTIGKDLLSHIKAYGRSKPSRTIFVCGLRMKPSKFELYVLDSDNGFKFEKQRGFVILGHQDAASFVRPLIKPELASLFEGLTAPVRSGLKIAAHDNHLVIDQRQPSDLPVVGVQQLGGLLGCLVNDAIKNKISNSVGGATSILTLTNAGIIPIDAKERGLSGGGFSSFTADETHHTFLERKKVAGPLLDAYGRVMANVSIDVWIS